MNWATAVFGMFSVLTASIVSFLAYVYTKEYNREKKLYEEYDKAKSSQSKALSDLVYIFEPLAAEIVPTKTKAPKASAATTTPTMDDYVAKIDKDKKDIN